MTVITLRYRPLLLLPTFPYITIQDGLRNGPSCFEDGAQDMERGTGCT